MQLFLPEEEPRAYLSCPRQCTFPTRFTWTTAVPGGASAAPLIGMLIVINIFPPFEKQDTPPIRIPGVRITHKDPAMKKC
ncbi:hypothetical protein [Streptomyces sp. bgisy084]|uniref:hypothetical protein n=1 Tax=unclassified Streptomyces TaxID=2593676 RepID=UPI003D752764